MEKIKNIYTIIATTVMLMGLPTVYLQAGSSLDREIAKIKSAPPKERVRLMNALKKRIFSLNREQRIRAIKKLRRYIATAPKSNRVAHKSSKRRAVVRDIHTNAITHRVEMLNHHPISSMVHEMGVPNHHHKDIITKMIEQNIAKPHRESSNLSSNSVVEPKTTHAEELKQTIPPKIKESNQVEHSVEDKSNFLNEAAKVLSDASKGIDKTQYQTEDSMTKISTHTKVDKGDSSYKASQSIKTTDTLKKSTTSVVKESVVDNNKRVEEVEVKRVEESTSKVDSEPSSYRVEPESEKRVEPVHNVSPQSTQSSHSKERSLYFRSRGNH